MIFLNGATPNFVLYADMHSSFFLSPFRITVYYPAYLSCDGRLELYDSDAGVDLLLLK